MRRWIKYLALGLALLTLSQFLSPASFLWSSFFSNTGIAPLDLIVWRVFAWPLVFLAVLFNFDYPPWFVWIFYAYLLLLGSASLLRAGEMYGRDQNKISENKPEQV